MHRIEYNEYTRGIAVSAWAQAYAYDSRNDSLHFLSIGGASAAVKAILSALVSARGLSVEIQAEEKLILSAPRWKRLRTLTQRLPSGACHGALLAGGGENDRETLILDATPERIYRHLYETFPVTATRDWTKWLLKELEAKRHLRFLISHGPPAALLSVTELELDAIISTGVKDRHIRF